MSDDPPPITTVINTTNNTWGPLLSLDTEVVETGQRLGHYVIEGELGRGGMGVVHAARDTRLDRRVALKLLPAEISADREARDRLTREAQLQAAIDHPNVATIHALDDQGGRAFIVIQLIDGLPLDRYLDAHDPSLATRLEIALQLAEALVAAHTAGVIHCDLKPRNIVVTGDGDPRVKVLDFGIARALTDAVAGQPGILVGTPGYMSPEQIEGGPVDERADVWAFGCILYELLTGHRAFPGRTPLQALDATINLRPDWSRLPDGVSPEIAALLKRCLVRDERSRPRAMTEARDHLREAAGAAAHTRRWSDEQARAARHALAPGDPAPRFVLEGPDGPVDSATLLAGGPLAVLFYRGLW